MYPIDRTTDPARIQSILSRSRQEPARQRGPRTAQERHPCRISGLTRRPFPRAHAPWVVVAGEAGGDGVSGLPVTGANFFSCLARPTGDQTVSNIG